ncbi:PPE family protein [Kibdelosporangium persicum]
MAARPSREAVARWNDAYSEQTAALFAAMRAQPHDVAAIRRLARGYLSVAIAWRSLAADLAVPMWARHASVIAAEEFERRAQLEDTRADLASIEGQDL